MKAILSKLSSFVGGVKSKHIVRRFSFRRIILVILCVVSICESTFGLTGDANVHDPSLIRVGSTTYVFSTGPSIRIRKTTDSTMQASWVYVGYVWETVPSWIVSHFGVAPPDIWAPDINYWNGTYYLYYSVAIIGNSNPPLIGLMTATNIEGPWTDQGQIISRTDGIDPNITWVGSVPYLSLGSWEGIYLHEIDPLTGKLSAANTTLSLLAKGIEASTIVQEGGYFYLFGSRGLCCSGVNSTYFTVVGRSSNIRGPYVDKDGVDMTNKGRTTVLSTSGNEIGPGGGDWFYVNGDKYFGYHYYDRANAGMATLNIRKIDFSSGWPVFLAPIGGIISGDVYHIINAYSGKAVGIVGGSVNNKALAEQSTYVGTAYQQFKISHRGEGNYWVSPTHAPTKALDAVGIADGNNVQQYDWWGGNNQRWKFVKIGSYYQIVNRGSGNCLTVPNSAISNNVTLVQSVCDSSPNKVFAIINPTDYDCDGDLTPDYLDPCDAITGLSSISEISKEEMLIYPNPSQGNFQIKVMVPGSLKIFDLNGTLLLVKDTETRSINSDLPTGIDIVKFRSRGGSATKKIIIK